MEFSSIDQLQSAIHEKRYIAEHGLATSLYLRLKLHRPLFLEGEAGVEKAEVAKIKIMASLEDLAVRLADLDTPSQRFYRQTRSS